jgi:hypothetical protein
MTVPFGTRNLYISCSDNRQFDGIRRLMLELDKLPAGHLLDWSQGCLDLSGRRVLRRVLISGHGNPATAGFELSSKRRLAPPDLQLPRNASLYLLGCHQGELRHRHLWAAGTGVALDSVLGCSGETESALSTCLLLHLLEDGPKSIDCWFAVWLQCNERFRPHFSLIRSTYASTNADPLEALVQLQAQGKLKPLFRDFAEFLSAISRQPAYLTGLV